MTESAVRRRWVYFCSWLVDVWPVLAIWLLAAVGLVAMALLIR